MKATRILVMIAILTPANFACRHMPEASEVKEFKTIPKSKEAGEVVDYKLSLVPDIPQVLTKYKPKYSREEKEDEFFDENDPEKLYFNLSFGTLTKEQFDRLQAAYYANPKLVYSDVRKYELVDFMPPQIQAMAGMRFTSESADSGIKVPLSAKIDSGGNFEFATFSNCWNAAYEILRGSTSTTSIYYVDTPQANAFYTDDRYSDSLKKYPLDQGWNTPENKAARNSGLRPFDVVLFSGETNLQAAGLQHVATYIDQDLYFEKTGPDSSVNYRFVTFDQIAAIYAPWRTMNVEVRRFKAQALPDAHQMFGYKATGQKLPAGFATPELEAKYPNLLNDATYYSPTNWDESGYRQIMVIVDVPLLYDAKLQRYQLDPASYKATLAKFGPKVKNGE